MPSAFVTVTWSPELTLTGSSQRPKKRTLPIKFWHSPGPGGCGFFGVVGPLIDTCEPGPGTSTHSPHEKTCKIPESDHRIQQLIQSSISTPVMASIWHAIALANVLSKFRASPVARNSSD